MLSCVASETARLGSICGRLNGSGAREQVSITSSQDVFLRMY